MRILLVASEAVPFIKTGGLADVIGALPTALAAAGHEVVLVVPLYGSIDHHKFALEKLDAKRTVPLGGWSEDAWVWRSTHGGFTTWFVDNPALFSRSGGPYGHPDDAASFAFFSRAAFELLRDPPDGKPVDALHANDWQTALALVHLHIARATDASLRTVGSVFTIHNLAYQGVFSADLFPLTGLSWDYFGMQGVEFWGRVNFMKGGLVFADVLNTVSEKYAREILTPQYGAGLEGVLAERSADLFGVLNGVDYDEWNPETDKHLPARYTATDVGPKELCRSSLLREMGLPRGDEVPLAGVVSRLAAQKGIDLLEARLPAILERVRLVLLGSGDAHFEETFRNAARNRPDRLAVKIGYDEALAHRIEAGAEMFLMPSAYEPCGLNQIYSLRYGTIPVVRATGGLDDTIIDADQDPEHGNGFKFDAYDADALVATVDRALNARRSLPRWQKIRANGMRADFSWARAAKRYGDLYARARAKASPAAT